jgi:hypothetical protein
MSRHVAHHAIMGGLRQVLRGDAGKPQWWEPGFGMMVEELETLSFSETLQGFRLPI